MVFKIIHAYYVKKLHYAVKRTMTNHGGCLEMMKLHHILGLSICLSMFAPMTQAAVIKDTQKAVHSTVVNDKQSPIEKALNQQKRARGDNTLISDNDQLKVLTSIKTAPTQNFFAEQHQRFSRFVQALFQPHSS